MQQNLKIVDQKSHINSLDGLRGLAVLMVFLSHTSGQNIYLFPGIDFTGIGKSGVYLFFILSSFLLTRQFINHGKDAINIKFLVAYSWRRFWRIYPLYFIYLFLLLLITFIAPVKLLSEGIPGVPFPLYLSDLVKQLLLVEGKGVTWSILVEFRYYLILPFIAFTYSFIFKQKILLSAIFTVFLAISMKFFWYSPEPILNDVRLGPYLPVFLLGSLGALIFVQCHQSHFVKSKTITLSLDVVGLLALVILVVMTPSVSSLIFNQNIASSHYHQYFFIFALLWLFVLFSCVMGSGYIRQFFELRVLRYLGLISFSFYLLHVVVMATIPPVIGQGWLILLVTIAISHLSWMFIERPAAKIRLFNQ